MGAASGKRRFWLIGLVGAVAVITLLAVGGAVWIVAWLNDNIDAPGPAASGSGACSAADAVNIRLVFADGRVSNACTKDRPSCAGTNTGAATSNVFVLNNQLRSESGRYIFLIRADFVVPADSTDIVIQVDPGVFMPAPEASPVADLSAPHALISIEPRSTGQSYNALSGTIRVSSRHHLVQGVIDASFTKGPPRPDRPQPTPAQQLATITGNFTCNG